jgi:choline/glycine/proline betaine transport protein
MNNISKPRFLTSVILILTITIIVSLNSAISKEFFLELQVFLSKYLGWMIILLANGFLIFSIFLIFTKYKNIRLGGPNAKPAFSYINWIAMLFSAGLGIGLLFYGVAEPIMHFNSYPGMVDGNTSYNAGKAIGLANLHWGLHGWAIYSALGLCFAFATYNKNLPFRVSSLLGSKVANNRPLAIAIDVIAIITTVFGVTTSLGLGTEQISAGLSHIFSFEETFINKIIIITVITLIGLLSVSLGLDSGIKRLSQINMVLAIVLLAFVFLFGPTVFIINALIQNFGAYINTLIETATWTEVYDTSSWQNGWTLFYYSWWFAWAPFVSLFIARISYGRSIKEFIIGVLFVPSIIVFLWMGIFGNAGIHQVINETSQLEQVVNNNFDVALFSLFEIYPLSKFISIVSLILIVTFFVTSSDSGALVASMLSSKKQTSINDDSPITSRATWAILLGVLAGVLLYAGGLQALQTSVVITGVPFAIIVVFACRKFYKSLEKELNK